MRTVEIASVCLVIVSSFGVNHRGGSGASGGLRRHHVASIEAETFIQGPKIAGARAALTLCRVFMAKAEAMPPFCMPTSIATVRQSHSESRQSLAPQ